MIEALSDISRTNQLKIIQSPEEIAEKLFQYLFRMGKGIESFSANNLDLSRYDDPSLDFYQKQHRAIKGEIRKRLSEYGEEWKHSDIQYFLSYSGGNRYVFFLSSNKTHSGWKQLFCKDRTDRERILNLIFKVHILSEELSIDTINGFEKLLLVHSTNPNKSQDGLVVWGQNLFLNYNPYSVITLTLSRKRLLFLQKDQYKTLDGEDMGDILVYKNKARNYYFSKKLDGRGKNSIKFMRFDREDEDFVRFKKTQLYHYQNLMTKLENFLGVCGIAYKPLHFQADCYLENPFIKNVESVETLEIINNSGTDLTEFDMQFLEHFLKHQGVSILSFYNSGKTISTYELVEVESEEDPCWKIEEAISWANIELDKGKNYLVFNKLLDEEAGSMAYQGDDGLWHPTTKISGKQKVDFYSQLKRRLSYLETGMFFSTQGLNITEFKAVGDPDSSSWSVINYSKKKIDPGILRQATQPFTEGQFLSVEDSICRYLIRQQDSDQLEKFYDKYKIKISPEFEKILIELGIKNWIRESLLGHAMALPVNSQPFSEKQFFAIYVRNPKYQEAKAVAVEFLYKEGHIYIKDVMRDVKEIKKRFPILRSRKTAPDQLINDQQYFVDEVDRVFISCYADDFYTPTLIGRAGILEDMENGTLKINRRRHNLLPLVLHYNSQVTQVKNLICLDLKNETFIQYYVPPAKALKSSIKSGFPVYHLIGNTYSKEPIPTSKLIKHPITALHFSTLTQNVLKISDNSQSSLLQKVAKVFIEN